MIIIPKNIITRSAAGPLILGVMTLYYLHHKTKQQNQEFQPDKKPNYFWHVVFGVVIFVLSVTFLAASVRNIRLRHYAEKIRDEIEVIQTENAELSRQIYALKNDPVYREAILRNELKRGKPGEIIIQRPN